MLGIRAIARHTFRDAMRKRLWVMILLYGGMMILPTFVFPAPPEGRVKLALEWSLWTMSFLGAVVVVFLAAPALWADIVDRTIYTVITKPVSRVEMLVGRLLGYMAVLLVLVLGMGVLGYAAVRYAASRVVVTDSASPPVLQTDAPIEATTGRRIPEPVIAEDDSMLARRKYHILSGVGPQRVEFQFRGLKPGTFSSGHVRFKFRFAVNEPTKQDRPATDVNFTVTNDSTGAQITGTLPVENGVDVYFPVKDAKKFFEGTSSVTVEIRRLNPAYTVAIVKKRAELLAQAESFGTSFTKALTLNYAGLMLLAVVALASSTILEGPVCILWTAFIYFVGSSMEVIRETADVLAPGRLTFIGVLYSKLDTSTPVGRTIEGITNVLRYFLNGLAKVLPDFSRFSTSKVLTQGLSISNEFFFDGLFYLVVFTLISMIIGFVAFRGREVGYK
ncbi:MAG: hypothetical protein V2A58_14395 [Planctomycetota bacterium]